jgi:hypothetical protein
MSMLLNQFHTTFRIDVSDGVFQQLTLIDLSKNILNINQYVLTFQHEKKKLLIFLLE